MRVFAFISGFFEIVNNLSTTLYKFFSPAGQKSLKTIRN